MGRVQGWAIRLMGWLRASESDEQTYGSGSGASGHRPRPAERLPHEYPFNRPRTGGRW